MTDPLVEPSVPLMLEKQVRLQREEEINRQLERSPWGEKPKPSSWTGIIPTICIALYAAMFVLWVL